MACSMCRGTDKLVRASCSHMYCDSCVNRELLRGPFACVTCKTPVARFSLSTVLSNNATTYSAASLSKELKLRRRLAKIYNRERGDFATEEEFYQYQEMAEDIAYRAVCGEDLEKEIAAYKAQNGPAIIARNQENEVKQREQRERDLREAEERRLRELEQREADRKEALARMREREKAISNIQKGDIDANEAAKRVEANLAKRRKRDEEAEEAQAKIALEQNKPKKEKSALPRPVGAVPLMAKEQRAIGNSYMGQLTQEQLRNLYRITACTSQGHEAVLCRARHEAGLTGPKAK